MISNEEECEKECNLLDVIRRQLACDPVVTETRVEYFRFHFSRAISCLIATHEATLNRQWAGLPDAG